jgi:4-hydroxybenzoyl-CoA reductase alpha subunit
MTLTLPEKREFTAVGQRVPRVDGYEKVTGTGQYVADIFLPGMLVGKVLRSPLPHARIVRLDTSRARKVPGVRAVVTAADTPKRRWGAFIQDQPVLALDKVRYVGEEVAAVAALDEDAALEALALIDVEYEELPAYFDPAEALAEDALLIHEDKPGNVALVIDVERGNVAEAFARADLVVEDTFRSTHQWHAPIETIGSVAEYKSGKLTVWMNTQTLFMARHRMAWALGLSESDIRIIQPWVGGGFGGKSCDDNNAMVCALLAMKAGRPVKLINTREEEFLAGSRPRVPMQIWCRMGFRKDGTIVAKQLDIIADNGAYCGKAPAITGVAALRHDTLYKYRDVKTRARLVYTNKIPTGAFRGFGNPSAEWAVEQVIDTAAHELGLDPLEVIRKNAAEPGYVSPHGNRVTSCELKQCVDKIEELMDWKRARAQKRPYRGLGVGATVHVSGKRHFGDYDGGSVVLKVNEDGKAMIWCGEGEAGQGPTTALCLIAAEELGIPFEDVSISQADTDLTTYCHGAYASRLTYIAGNAVRDAARNMKQQILQIAAELLEAAPEDLEIRNGVISVKGSPEGAKTTTVREVAHARLFRRGGAPLVAAGSFDPDSVLQDATRYGNESGAYNFACQAAEVEVDPETGKVTVLRYAAASDCGTVIYPLGAEGQVEGSVAQGLGYTLTEGFVWENGRPLNPNFSDYRIPTAGDMPPLQSVFADSYEPTGPFGAKGLGELAMDPFAAVIGNAIFDACGIRIKTLPITAEKVFWALREKEAREAGGAGAPPA